MRIRATLLAFACTLLSAGAAQAAAEVIGDGPARVCFLAASAGRNASLDIGVCDEALATDLSRGDRAATFINRGVIFLSLKKYDAAVDDFDRGIQIMPELGEGYLNRGATLIAEKRFSEALGDIDKGIALGVSKPYIGYYDRAIANEALGNLKAAYDDYRQVLALKPDFERASNQLKRFKIVDKPSGA